VRAGKAGAAAAPPAAAPEPPPASSGRRRPEPKDTPAPAGPPTVRPAGALDGTTAAGVCAQFAARFAGGAAEVRLDLADVTDVDPAGLALLARAARAAARRRPPVVLRVANAAPPVSALLRLTRLDRAYQTAGPGG
jgi:ABC-type transporter Mla MlaB component